MKMENANIHYNKIQSFKISNLKNQRVNYNKVVNIAIPY